MIEFTLYCRPFSINAYRYRDQRFKTKEAKAWEIEVLELLKNVPGLPIIAEQWRTDGGGFRLWIEVVYPYYMFYNKAKQISAKTMDVTNFEKPLVDLIFQKTMEVDDRFLIECHSSKTPSSISCIKIRLELDTQVSTDATDSIT